jgi:hypothetical protein
LRDDLHLGRAGLDSTSLDDPRHGGARDEAADVRAVRDTALAREHERQQVVEQQVHAQHQPRRDHEHVHQERRQEGQHAHGVPGEQHVVEAEHTRDRARGADERQL